MSDQVIDASALLALIFQEPGAAAVQAAIEEGVIISMVNLSEVIARLSAEGSTREQIDATLRPIRLEAIDFDTTHAWHAGLLRPLTQAAGLSFGDRACLALARHLGLPVLTADRVWAQLDVGVEVVVCR